MKLKEYHFEEYVNNSLTNNLHPKLEKIYNKFPNNVNNLKNIIFYGPPGTGKYTQLLRALTNYSNSGLKYEKKISVMFNKEPYYLKISDIHIEVDMSLLGCNSKLLWHEIYLQIIDIISTKSEKTGIVVCKYFHDIHNELLENFYSYMQNNNLNSVSIKYILLTEHISFIPDNILNCCQVIKVPRPTKAAYNKCLDTKLDAKYAIENITNIKNLNYNVNELMHPHIIICNKIVNNIININNINFLKFRDLLYDVFIYNLDICKCLEYILQRLIKQNNIKREDFSKVLIKTFNFLLYYNNNYRPIYHLENYLYYLASIIHGYNI